ncbi:hypothetical protein [Desemzia sp. FAM 23989]|uniref:hypothetical protein n=1 Tax=Desemzia sp. FAM 23989 TaxID=3259523 RepID=UPI00388A8A1D
MAKLIVNVGCTYTGELEGDAVIEELKSGGFKDISTLHPHYQAMHELDLTLSMQLKEAFIALVDMGHQETMLDIQKEVARVLKSGCFELTSIELGIGY